MERYPANTPLSVDALRSAGWKEIVAKGSKDGNVMMSTLLGEAAKAAGDAQRFEQARALWLLADVASMMLKADRKQDPFGPMMEIGGHRSAVPADLDQEALAFLTNVLAECDEPWLRARIADVLWVRTIPRQIAHARAAIDAYNSITWATDAWGVEGRECWQRAIMLCQTIGAADEGRLARLERDLLAAFRATDAAEPSHSVGIAAMLRAHGLCSTEGASIGSHLQGLAKQVEGSGDNLWARDMAEEASQWYADVGDKQLEVDAIVQVAELCVKEGRARTGTQDQSHAAAASWIESAIQCYRRVPRAMRANRGIEDRITGLRAEMSKYGEKSLEEMAEISGPEIDLSQQAKAARAAVQGKSMEGALASLARICRGAKFKDDQEFAQSLVREHPLRSLFAGKYISRDGRTVAKTKGGGLGDDADQDFVWAEMMRHYQTRLNVVVMSSIIPAWRAVMAEHRVSVGDCVAIARRSPIIPAERAELFGKALSHGLEGDFGSAVHLLAPQVENLVRTHLKRSGEKTTNLNTDGIEHENGLSSLMEGEAADRVLGVDLAYEIRALFCDPLGPNLRNEVAHGLMDDAASGSAATYYAWWFGLRIAFIYYPGAAQSASVAETGMEKRPKEKGVETGGV